MCIRLNEEEMVERSPLATDPALKTPDVDTGSGVARIMIHNLKDVSGVLVWFLSFALCLFLFCENPPHAFK